MGSQGGEREGEWKEFREMMKEGRKGEKSEDIEIE